MGRTGGQTGERLPVTEHYRAPFNSVFARPLFGTIPVELYAPQMPAINVVAIRIEENCFLVRRERPLFYFTTSRGKKLRRTSGGGQDIQMLPAVFLGSDDKLIAGGPIDYAAAGILRHVWERSLRRHAAMPYFFSRPYSRLCYPDGPRMRFVRSNEEALGRVSRLRGSPNKSDTLPLQRPRGITVGIDRWRHELHSLRCNIIDSDECVVRSSRDEGQPASVRRPLWIGVLPAHKQLVRLFRSVEGADQDLPILRISNHSELRNLRRMASINALRLAAAPRHRPDRLLGSRRIAGRIRHLAGCVLPFTAYEDNRVGVRRKTQIRYLLPVVVVVFCELSGRECRPFGHPDISPALLIECPGDAIAFLCGRQIRRERRTHQLLQRDRFLRARQRHQNHQSHCTQQSMTSHRSISSMAKKSYFIRNCKGQSAACRTTVFSTETFGPSSGPEIFMTCPAPKSIVP